MQETTQSKHTREEWAVGKPMQVEPCMGFPIHTTVDSFVPIAHVFSDIVSAAGTAIEIAHLISATLDLLAALEAAVGDFDAPCPHCSGKGKIPGSRNWVAQGATEADCWHCGASGKAVNLDWYKPAQDAIAKARGAA